MPPAARIDRRALIAGLAVGAASPAFAAPALSLREAARRMAIYGLPLIETASTRARAFKNGLVANTFRHSRTLTTAKTQTVTQPNNDTLYSSGWLDLSSGPVQVTLPASGDRYLSVALMDPYSNNFAVLGTRTTGPDGGVFTVAGPGHAAPGPNVIHSPTNWVWILARTLVDGPADLAGAHAVQDGLKISGPAGRKAQPIPGRDAPWPDMFRTIQAPVLESPPPATDARLFAETRALGVSLTGGFDPARFTAAEGQEIAAGLSQALEDAKGGDDNAIVRGGWIFPRPNLGDFGQDYLYRAQIALSGLAGLPLDEALYLRPLGPDGRAELDSTKAWKLALPAKPLPVDAFWSLTVYEVTPQGQAFLIENPIDRYAIGDRTPGLVRGPDGRLEIIISPKPPKGALKANWLPAPTSGRPMLLNLRAYLPRPELTSGAYPLPPLRRA